MLHYHRENSVTLNNVRNEVVAKGYNPTPPPGVVSGGRNE